jgi:ABC-2 type transport system ATP-binding protein
MNLQCAELKIYAAGVELIVHAFGGVGQRRSLRTMLVRLSLAGFTLSVIGTCVATTQPASAITTETTCPNASAGVVKGSPSYDYTRGCIVSFDGTPIVYNLFTPLDASAGHPVYTIMEGPGWGSAGSTTPDSRLISSDYAELTWDPRGFGESGGVAQIDSPAAEGRDVSSLIDQVLTGHSQFVTDRDGADGQPKYSNDSTSSNSYGEPVVGMAGASYGGGIQLSASAFDNRIKAIVPSWAWNNLDYSLDPGNVIKLGWGELLFGGGLAETALSHIQGDTGNLPVLGGTAGLQTGGYDANIWATELEGLAIGDIEPSTLAWLADRSMAVFGAGPSGHVPDVPTLLVQGTVDTLFNLNEASANLQEIKAAHPNLPVKLIAFCGGHVSCPTGGAPGGIGYSDVAPTTSPIAPGQSANTFTENQTIDWFNHYLRGKGRSDSMPDNVVYQDQNGGWYGISAFPTSSKPGPAKYVNASFRGTLVSSGIPTGVGPLGIDSLVTDGTTNAADPGQITIPVVTAPADHDLPIVGEGHVNMVVDVIGASTNLFFRLIDKETGDVVDLQTAPIRLDNFNVQGGGANPNIPPTAQMVSLNLNGVAFDLPAGDTLELQVSTSTLSFAPNRVPSLMQLFGQVSVPELSPEH